MVYSVNVSEVDGEDLLKREAKATKVKYLIDQRHGASNFYLRMYEIQPGGQTPYDYHQYEHEVFILRGRAHLLTMKDASLTKHEVREGDAIFIGPYQVHQFVNVGEEPFQMLCIKGATKAESEVEAATYESVC